MRNYNLDFTISFFEDWSELKKFIIPKYPFIYDVYWGNIQAKMDFEKDTLKKIFNSYGLKLYSLAWTNTILDIDVANKILNLSNELAQKRIGYIDKGMLCEKIENTESKEIAWYKVYSDSNDDYKEFALGDFYPKCKAFRYTDKIHIQNNHYVSEEFKACVEKNKLSGLKFFWVMDVGKYKARQWHCAVAEEPIGHGLDHEWFDRDNYVKNSIEKDKIKPDPISNNLMRFNSLFRSGIWHFDSKEFKNTWTTGIENYDQLLSKFPKESRGLRFISIPRFQKKYLPKTDFAYAWSRVDGPNYEGNYVRERDLYINQRAKDVLLQNNLIEERRLVKVIICEEIPDGVADLDNNAKCPPPVYTNEEYLERKILEEKYYQKFCKSEKEVRKPTIKEVLSKLKKEKRKRPDDFMPGVNITEINTYFENSPIKYPNLWTKILQITSGGGPFDSSAREYYFTPLEEIIHLHKEIVSVMLSIDEEYSGGLVYFGSTMNGDYLAFKKLEQEIIVDCPILKISHEDPAITTEWSSIIDFLFSLLDEV